MARLARVPYGGSAHQAKSADGTRLLHHSGLSPPLAATLRDLGWPPTDRYRTAHA